MKKHEAQKWASVGVDSVEKARKQIKKKEEFLQVGLKDSMSAVPILNAICPFIEGFEMVQGSMDDVFLNVTGRTLEG